MLSGGRTSSMILRRVASSAAASGRRQSHLVTSSALLSPLASSPGRVATTSPNIMLNAPAPLRSLASATTLESSEPAKEAWTKSCYYEIDYTIDEDATVYEAVQRFSAFNIGALVTLDADGEMSGVLSERDYICKVALLGRTSKETKIKEISTKAANVVTARPEDSIEDCMEKMLTRGIRHLPLVDEEKKLIGMLSVKDLVKEVVKEKEQQIEKLANFALGKGGNYGSE